MFKFIILTVISAIISNFLISVPCVDQYLSRIFGSGSKIRLLTVEELSRYNGADGAPLYLSILGNVYEVTRSERFYGPGESYHAFVGRDNSKNFVVGDLSDDGVSDKVIGMSQAELRSLHHWVQFYKKEYVKVGKLIGRYYNALGKLTTYGKEVKNLIREAELAQANDDAEKITFPPCNIEWEPSTGTRVWCTNRSGGIERTWVGVPRQVFQVGASPRCACIHDGNKHLATLKEYEGCDRDSESCFINNDSKTT